MTKKLYKYINSKFATKFIKEGDILFRNLAYFINYEKDGIRGDYWEGTRVFRPNGGLEITKMATGERFKINKAFTATADVENIFVFCLSKSLEKELFKNFECDTCIEITNIIEFLSRVEKVINLRNSTYPKQVWKDSVNYYKGTESPQARWAVPEQIIYDKHNSYLYQNEYRISFSEQNAMSVENVKCKFVDNEESLKINFVERECKISIGDISHITQCYKVDDKRTG